MNNKIKNLISKISINLKERDEVICLSILALLSGESIFLLGPPGVGKSLVSRKVKDIIFNAKSFEYLMNRFSTPDEIFGPISLKKLDEDKYERKIQGYLPDSEIVFLDEIWKASPSIQNTLLTIINEKIYMNGNILIKVPMLLLIAASNELPAKNEGLEALYDRFIIRLYVENIKSKDNFRTVIDSTNFIDEKIHESEKITLEEINKIKIESSKIKLDDNTFNFIVTLKEKLNIELGEFAPYISDRRWKKIISILKTSAYLSNRDKINGSDWLLIQEMIWDDYNNYQKISKIFIQCWKDHVLKANNLISFEDINRNINNIRNLIDKGIKKYKKVKSWTILLFDPNLRYLGFKDPNNSETYFISYDEEKDEILGTKYYCIKNKYIDFTKSTIDQHSKIDYDFGKDPSITKVNKQIHKSNKTFDIILKQVVEYNYNIIDEANKKNNELLNLVNNLLNKNSSIINNIKKDASIFSLKYSFYISEIENDIVERISEFKDKINEFDIEIKNAFSNRKIIVDSSKTNEIKDIDKSNFNEWTISLKDIK